jgi:adenine-specific DNA-methyltransferase
MIELKAQIAETLAGFSAKPLRTAALDLLATLGYRSEKTLELDGSPAAFLDAFPENPQKPFRPDKARVAAWRGIHLLFQLTDAEIRGAVGQSELAFDSTAAFEDRNFRSYLFVAVDLAPDAYTRTQLAEITREINRLFLMPVLVIFRHGESLTLAVIDRRLNKRDATRDVLDKVTVIKDIRAVAPHRAHIEILHDLALGQLTGKDRRPPSNFVELHDAWRKALDVQTLNRRFFIEIRNWFYWARQTARFPAGAVKDADGRDSEALIRLLTRMIFCWFLREKRLLPAALFEADRIAALLRDWSAADADRDRDGRYYKAILQNLFFATLSTPVEERKFRSARSYKGKNTHYGDQRFFRHVTLFAEKAPVEDLYKRIPFLNGGLFENLDEVPGRDPDIEMEVRIDGFSDVAAKQPLLPDCLFFGSDRIVPELAAAIGETAAQRARGLLDIFRDYKFTIEENTPLEEDIALDPELLGRAFENLLASVNPETGTVARKSTGSFYTPREIVHYMVSESLVRYLLTALAPAGRPSPGLEPRIRELVSEEEPGHSLTDAEADRVVALLGSLRILDPACGSGAFPMGLLQLLVHVLRKLDPGNERWKAAKLDALPPEMREKAEQIFAAETFDYTRKLELVKDCIHGVDIQPSAIQISKLRFFLSLVIEQTDPARLRPLPNLETKFVCANSLLGLPRPDGWELFQHQIEPKEQALLRTRSRYFFAQTKAEKDTCRKEDRKLRRELAVFIEGMGGSSSGLLASAVAGWDPYKSDRRAGYFDPESMFGVRDGFDITIGNPPYVRADEQSDWNQVQRKAILECKQYDTLWEKWDLYVPFIERGYKLLRPGGVSTMIVSDAFCHSKYAQKAQNWLLQHARILRLDFCAELKIFDAAVHNVITILQNAPGATWKPDRRVHKETFGNVTLLPTDEQQNLTYRAFFPEDGQSTAFGKACLLLDRICYVSYGLRPNSDEKDAKGEFTTADVVSEKRDAVHCKPYVEGKHLAPWLALNNLWIEWGTSRAPSRFCRQTFSQLHFVAIKIIVQKNPGPDPIAAIDEEQLIFNSTVIGFLPWHYLSGVRNNSLKKAARYVGEKPPRPDLPKREELEVTSQRFSVKYLLGVMNSATARDFLRANRRHNVSLYPDDWKKLPIPDVAPEQQQPVIALVDQILTTKRANPAANITPLETQVDTLVATLYGVDIAPC